MGREVLEYQGNVGGGEPQGEAHKERGGIIGVTLVFVLTLEDSFV